MEYKLGLYEKALPAALSLEEKLDTTARCGFDQLELSVDETEERLARLANVRAAAKEIRAAQDRTGVAVKTMCLSGHRRFPLGSHEPSVRRTALEIMERALELSCEAGIRLIQVAGYDVYYEEPDGKTASYFCEGLRRAVELAAKYGVVLGFETMETPFMDTVQKAMCYVQSIASPYLGVYPDIGNLKNAAVLYKKDVVEDMRQGQGHIFAAHFKETLPGIYRDLSFGSGGHTEYERCAAELWRQGVRAFTGEFWHKDGEDYQQSISAAAVFLRGKIERGMQDAHRSETGCL